jgi:hypothetical protein
LLPNEASIPVPFVEIFIPVAWIEEAKNKPTGQYPDKQTIFCLDELCNDYMYVITLKYVRLIPYSYLQIYKN